MGKFRQLLEKSSEFILDNLLNQLDSELAAKSTELNLSTDKADVPAFTLYFREWVGSFNYADKPYHDGLGDSSAVNKDNIKAYVDCGQCKLYSDAKLTSALTGTMHYVDKSSSIMGSADTNKFRTNLMHLDYSFVLNDININGAKKNGYVCTVGLSNQNDNDGYYNVGDKVKLTVVGATGDFEGVTGKVILTNTGLNAKGESAGSNAKVGVYVYKLDFYI